MNGLDGFRYSFKQTERIAMKFDKQMVYNQINFCFYILMGSKICMWNRVALIVWK